MIHFDTISSVLVEQYGCEWADDAHDSVVLPPEFEEASNVLFAGDNGQAVVEYLEYSADLESIKQLADLLFGFYWPEKDNSQVARLEAAYEEALTDGWETLIE